MQEASVMGLIRTILIIMAIYYVAKFFMKYIAPVLLVKYVEKKTGQQQTKKETVTKEGTTTIDKKPQQNSTVSDNVGEYVDYEEVD
ncbi:DUF4834 domain-containing protein [Wenyingzhuangia sp. 2_MG-2023]|uniref:DUF4834 domain-containing protein n=1 Tax=Wenyingzhuangia sp. 2_MG-2023 TaxID=3062639 RepID=UPI0026E1F207|nr:DUF4834 domain-containing protein [Wenyingzhuangia sp. 2_MG-2023]MDO6737803.1 DUF4834 domain-containing protein [Wenyingzhuangia sp. 2_MG-2023]MDO6802086.1 DUF4834 domain-containing protein [Wenyingzhuangia sp. 1_MG-2023]